MSTFMEPFVLTIWIFMGPSGEERRISAIFPMTEQQAVDRAIAKGWQVDGWKCKRLEEKVLLGPEPALDENGEPKGLRTFTVRVSKTSYCEVEVEAEDEEEAAELGLKEAKDSGDFWDDDFEVDEVEEVEE